MNREWLLHDLITRANLQNLYFDIIGLGIIEKQPVIITYDEPLNQFREEFGGQINRIPHGDNEGRWQWKLLDKPAYIASKELVPLLNRGNIHARNKVYYAWEIIKWWEERHAGDC